MKRDIRGVLGGVWSTLVLIRYEEEYKRGIKWGMVYVGPDSVGCRGRGLRCGDGDSFCSEFYSRISRVKD